MEDFVRFLIAPLVSNPNLVKIEDQGGLLMVTVPQADMGRVIGKHGQAVFHLRVLIRTYCKAHHLTPKHLQVQETTG